MAAVPATENEEKFVHWFEVTSRHECEIEREINYNYQPFSHELESDADEKMRASKIYQVITAAVSAWCHRLIDGKVVSKSEMEQLSKIHVILDGIALMPQFARLYGRTDAFYAKYYVHR